MTASQPKLDTKEQRHEYLRDVFHATLLPYLETLTKDQIKIEEIDEEPTAADQYDYSNTRDDCLLLFNMTGKIQEFLTRDVDLGKHLTVEVDGFSDHNTMKALSRSTMETTNYWTTYSEGAITVKGNSQSVADCFKNKFHKRRMTRLMAHNM